MGVPKELLPQLTPFLQKYPVPVLDLHWESPGIVQGFVLTKKQADQLQKLLPHTLFKLKILENTPPDSFAIGNTSPITLYTSPTQDKIATQWEKTEPPFRKIWTHHSSVLVQKHEKTLGWIFETDIVSATPLLLSTSSFSVEKFLQHLESAIGIPYLLGGRSASAVDCSGLIQRALWNACQLNYPRHSLDQMKISRRKEFGSEEPGDLIFARSILKNTQKNILHVAVCIEKDFVIHACLQKEKVVKMSHTEFFERYTYAGTRAITPPLERGSH